MALSRVKTWVAGEVLFASDQNAEFNNILNNPMSLISPFTASVDAGGFDITALDELGLSDATAVPTSGRIRRNGNLLQWLIDGSHTNAVLDVLALIATTSGSPAAGIGTGFKLQSESADENPSDLVGVQGAFSDVTAGSEDSLFRILLRVAGRALDAKYEFTSTAGDGFTAIFAHAVTADRTYTLPDSTGTIALTTSLDPHTITTGAASPPVANTLYKDNIPKVWARVANSGSPTLSDSFNVSGVVDDATGQTTITIDTDMANANYAAVAGLAADTTVQSTIYTSNYATTGFRVTTRNATDVLTDYDFTVHVFGDQ